MHPNTAAALVQGRQRWVARMREAKAAGQIERFPNGRRARHLPPLARDTTIRKAQRILERLVSMSGNGNATSVGQVPVTPSEDRPWEMLTKAQKLAAAADLALDAAYKILQLGVDPADPKLLAIIKDTALSVISHQIRVDTAALSATAPRRDVREMSSAEFDALLDEASEVPGLSDDPGGETGEDEPQL